MTDDQPGRHVVIGGVFTIVAVAGLSGAALGHALSDRTGLEEVTVLSITFTVTPTSLALYGAVAVGTFLATLLVVLTVVSRFDDGTI